ncbi:hypothetical protein AAZX31_06G115800 [Glycine max]|uniref:Uncharacterized protein n=1 Tax=Glycine max TaxID=3847 RepID=K7KUM9_SOYBN|nr:hypothetical protein JHK85_015446 [Glycine max]KAG5045684.1 hypothetical protein JHK86_015090 [Glycine max]KAG5148190.1 hypothetical protein JHK82_015071 [Glycine max]KAH1125497.1 hypothetical protein GYH30_014868 [Glycine max]KAH1245452.1 hypothetical protein GmHk_06G015790 [Glycine max]
MQHTPLASSYYTPLPWHAIAIPTNLLLQLKWRISPLLLLPLLTLKRPVLKWMLWRWSLKKSFLFQLLLLLQRKMLLMLLLKRSLQKTKMRTRRKQVLTMMIDGVCRKQKAV